LPTEHRAWCSAAPAAPDYEEPFFKSLRMS
jgi:hypothetical protein